MFASGRPIWLLLCYLFSSATSSPVSMFTPAPPLPLQISSPSLSEAILPSPPSPSLSDFQTTEDVNCTLTMTPSILVVRFGDPVKATCSVPKMRFYGLGWEVSLASPELMMNRTLVWSVDKMTEWSIKPKCYALSEKGDCHIELPVIVYKPPDNVSISFVNHTGPMFEGHQYTLQCSVEKVAPVENLVVTFYRGRTALGQQRSKHNDTEKKPLTEIFSLDIIPSKEHNGAQYWCEAKLELGPEGPQPPPVVTSQNISTTVYYKPQLESSRYPDTITIKEGDPLQLNCSAVGNPRPSFTWTLPTQSPSTYNSSVLTIKSVTLADGGLFTCTVSNIVGTVTVKLNVDVQENYNGIIIGVIVAVVVLIVVSVLIVYFYFYKQNRMGQYNLKDVFRLHQRHVPVPTVE